MNRICGVQEGSPADEVTMVSAMREFRGDRVKEVARTVAVILGDAFQPRASHRQPSLVHEQVTAPRDRHRTAEIGPYLDLPSTWHITCFGKDHEALST